MTVFFFIFRAALQSWGTNARENKVVCGTYAHDYPEYVGKRRERKCLAELDAVIDQSVFAEPDEVKLFVRGVQLLYGMKGLNTVSEEVSGLLFAYIAHLSPGTEEERESHWFRDDEAATTLMDTIYYKVPFEDIVKELAEQTVAHVIKLRSHY